MDEQVNEIEQEAKRLRLAGLDAARGLAYLGMVAVNFHLVMTHQAEPARLVPEGLQQAYEALFGRAAAAFVLIAGVGLSLMARRPPRSSPSGWSEFFARLAFILLGALAVFGIAFHVGRAARLESASVASLDQPADWQGFAGDLGAFVTAKPESVTAPLIIAGMVLLGIVAVLFLAAPGLFASVRGTVFLRALFLAGVGYLWQPIWSGDILHFYGLWLLLALPLLRAPSWLLLLLLPTILLGTVGLHALMDYGEHWTESMEHGGFWTLGGQIRDLAFDGWHPLFPWFGFLIVGLLFGRLRLEGWKAPLSALLVGLVLLVGIPPLRLFLDGQIPGIAPEVAALLDVTAIPPGPLYFLHALGFSLTLVAACFLLVRVALLRRLMHPLVQTGRLAFTLYLLHVLVGMGTLDALRMTGDQGLPLTTVVVVVVGLLSMAFACAWLALFRMGPLEWVMRRVCR